MNPLFEYTVSSLIWAGGGLVVGFAFGRLTRTVDRMASNVETITEAVTEGSPTVTTPARRRRPTSEQMVGAIVVLLGLFTAAQSLYQDSATRRVAECTRAYSNGFADALDARSTASAEAQEALDGLMATVGEVMTTAAGTPQARLRVQEAVSDYLAKRAESKKKQQENPFPPAPRDLCR